MSFVLIKYVVSRKRARIDRELLASPKSYLIGKINYITSDTFKKLMESCIFVLKEFLKERKEREEIEVNEYLD